MTVLGGTSVRAAHCTGTANARHGRKSLTRAFAARTSNDEGLDHVGRERALRLRDQWTGIDRIVPWPGRHACSFATERVRGDAVGDEHEVAAALEGRRLQLGQRVD